MKNEKLNIYIDDEDNTIQLEGYQQSPEESLIIKEKLQLVEQIIPTLKKRYRDLLIAKLEGKSYKELSEQFALSEDRIKTDLHKARKTIKNKLSLLTNT